MAHALVCIMPRGHPLAAKRHVEPPHLDRVPFVAFNRDSAVGQRVAAMLETHKVKAHVVLVANVSPTLCEFVAAGLGVSLVHPLMVSGFERHLAVRRFKPDIPFDFQLCRNRDNRNAELVQAFLKEVRATAKRISSSSSPLRIWVEQWLSITCHATLVGCQVVWRRSRRRTS
jgi:DNA-binding transcriptional LysR family regulator